MPFMNFTQTCDSIKRNEVFAAIKVNGVAVKLLPLVKIILNETTSLCITKIFPGD